LKEEMKVGPVVVFTDVDGTLLDHFTYDFRPALPAIERLNRLAVPVVLCSSKTLGELRALQQLIGVGEAPLIAENGGVVWFPDVGESPSGEVILGPPVDELEQHLRSLEERFGFSARTIVDMSLDEVMERTGLPPEAAWRARQRKASLPFVVVGADPPWPDVEKAAEAEGLRLTRGGRFRHLLGSCDKGEAVELVLDVLTERWKTRPLSVGLGDSRNDLPLLEAVDVPIRIPNPESSAPLGDELPWAMEVEQPGPAGWREAVERWMRGDVP